MNRPLTMTERDLQSAIIDAAHAFGWKVAHFRPARTAKGWRTPVEADGAGFPDLLMVRRERLLVVELKRAGELPTDEQQAWLDAFRLAGVDALLWRPEDLERAEEVLR